MRGAVLLLALAACANAEYYGFVGASAIVAKAPAGKNLPEVSKPGGQLIVAIPLSEAGTDYSYSIIEPSGDGTTTTTGYARRVWSYGRVYAFGLGQAGVSATQAGSFGGAFAGGAAATVEVKPNWFVLVGARYQSTPNARGMIYTGAIGRRF